MVKASKYSANEASRLRLRYDMLAHETPALLTTKPADWAAKNPTDGITNAIDKELRANGASVPGGTIGIRTRAVWRLCVRARRGLSTRELVEQRERDVAEVKQRLADVDAEVDAERVAEFVPYYGLNLTIKFEDGPPGGPGPVATSEDASAVPAQGKRKRNEAHGAADNKANLQGSFHMTTRAKRARTSVGA